MSKDDRHLVAAAPMALAWRMAARDLSVRFLSPIALIHAGRQYWCSGLLPDFGSRNGALIIDRHSPDDIFDVADALEYFASGLSPFHYEAYDRERFMETLDDWGWFADPDHVPDWFTGGIGRHGGALEHDVPSH